MTYKADQKNNIFKNNEDNTVAQKNKDECNNTVKEESIKTIDTVWHHWYINEYDGNNNMVNIILYVICYYVINLPAYLNYFNTDIIKHNFIAFI